MGHRTTPSGVHHIRGPELTYPSPAQRISLKTKEFRKLPTSPLSFISLLWSSKTLRLNPPSILHIGGAILT